MTANATIAVIGDSSMDRFIARRMLGEAHPGCEVIEFSYAEEAVSYLKSPSRKAIDLILIDINLPRMNGFEFADSFASLYPELKGHTRVIMVSHSINPADQERAKAHPAIDSYKTKPLTPGILDVV